LGASCVPTCASSEDKLAVELFSGIATEVALEAEAGGGEGLAGFAIGSTTGAGTVGAGRTGFFTAMMLSSSDPAAGVATGGTLGGLPPGINATIFLQ